MRIHRNLMDKKECWGFQIGEIHSGNNEWGKFRDQTSVAYLVRVKQRCDDACIGTHNIHLKSRRQTVIKEMS